MIDKIKRPGSQEPIGQPQYSQPPAPQQNYGSYPEQRPRAAAAGGDGMDADLEGVREILWGRQARVTSTRIDRVENKVGVIERDLSERVDQQIRGMSDSVVAKLTTTQRQMADQMSQQAKQTSSQIRTLRQDLTRRIDQQSDTHEAEMRNLKRDIYAYVDQRADQQAAQLRQVQDELTARMEQLAADLFGQLTQIQKTVSEQVVAVSEEQTQRLMALRNEAMRQDDTLRQDLVGYMESIDAKKAARQELAKLYSEIGRRLYDG